MLTECERGACCSSPGSALRSSAGSAVAYARAAPLDGQFLRALTRSLMVPDRTRQDKHHFATDKAALSVHGVTGAFVSVLAMQSYFPADQKKKMNAACRQLSCHPSCVIHGELFITMHAPSPLVKSFFFFITLGRLASSAQELSGIDS